jgi:hypothetical protein
MFQTQEFIFRKMAVHTGTVKFVYMPQYKQFSYSKRRVVVAAVVV